MGTIIGGLLLLLLIGWLSNVLPGGADAAIPLVIFGVPVVMMMFMALAMISIRSKDQNGQAGCFTMVLIACVVILVLLIRWLV